MSSPANEPPSSSGTTYRVSAEVSLEIVVHNPDAIERVTGAAGDEWRSLFYRLETVDHVLQHWTYNALCNGIRDVSLLEGWGDLDATAVTFELEYGIPSVEVSS